VRYSVDQQPPGHGVGSAQSCEIVCSGTGDAGQPQGIEMVEMGMHSAMAQLGHPDLRVMVGQTVATSAAAAAMLR
jgi:hypothetical protein